MVRARFLRSVAIALGVYGALGLFIAAAMLVLGIATFSQVGQLQDKLESQRMALVQSIRTVSGTLQDTASATTNFVHSIDNARGAVDQASMLANDSAGNFRDLATRAADLTVFGFQPLAGIAPQFSATADHLQQMAIQLGATRDSLAQNGTDVQQVGGDLAQIQSQLDAVANSLSQPGVLGLDTRVLLPFQIAFFGMCLLVILQSAFSIVAGIALYRLQRALGAEPLFPHLSPDLRTATTTDGAGRDRVRSS